MCIKPHDEYTWNFLRRFFKLDVMKMIYYYNCGTPLNTNLKFLVPEQMYNQALAVVKSNELQYLDLSKSLTEHHIDRLNMLSQFKRRKEGEKQNTNMDSLKKEMDIMDNKLEEVKSMLNTLLKHLGK